MLRVMNSYNWLLSDKTTMKSCEVSDRPFIHHTQDLRQGLISFTTETDLADYTLFNHEPQFTCSDAAVLHSEYGSDPESEGEILDSFLDLRKRGSPPYCLYQKLTDEAQLEC